MSEEPSQLGTLTSINIQDFLASFGLENWRLWRKVMQVACWPAARLFARQMVSYDNMVSRDGLHRASQLTLRRYLEHLEIVGQGNIPTSGPVLVLSNHPGMTDTLALFTSILRPDLKVIAAHRPFLQALPHTSQYLIFVSDDPKQRMGVVRQGVQHLRSGGLALTFPAGEIEPDPACMPGALVTLEKWSESIAVFARMVPDLKIVTAIVSGVIWPAALRHPLARLRRQQKDRERLAAALQVFVTVLQPFYKPLCVRVAFSPAITAREVSNGQPDILLQAVTAQARLLIESCCQPAAANSLTTLRLSQSKP